MPDFTLDRSHRPASAADAWRGVQCRAPDLRRLCAGSRGGFGQMNLWVNGYIGVDEMMPARARETRTSRIENLLPRYQVFTRNVSTTSRATLFCHPAPRSHGRCRPRCRRLWPGSSTGTPSISRTPYEIDAGAARTGPYRRRRCCTPFFM
jgi:hypothetical protein